VIVFVLDAQRDFFSEREGLCVKRKGRERDDRCFYSERVLEIRRKI
jgi:hypothetical protein